MGIRAFKWFTVTSGTTQPLVGTTLSAAVTAKDAAQSVQVGDSSMFQVGDYVIVGTIIERLRITAIADSTHITAVFPSNVLTGANVILYAPCTQVYVQTKDANAGTIFVGPTSTITASTAAGAVAELTKVSAGAQPVALLQSNVYGGNPYNIANFWITGSNTSDNYLPSFDST